MNRGNPINISKSSLIGLQAELARKREEVSRNQNHVQQKSKRLEMKPHIQEELKALKQKKAKTKLVPDFKEDDSAALDQSKSALITKSLLYDKLRNHELKTSDSKQFLVDFEANEPENESVTEEGNANYDSDPDNEWITFTDSLGRTRTCLRSDASYYKELDSKLSVEKNEKENSESSESRDEHFNNKRPIILSEEMRLWEERREELRKNWEEEEKKMSEKRDIHYQDILFDEARTHGVGYFNFSRDETERQKQHEELLKLRKETEENQQLSMSIKERRQQQMKRRIEAAKRRKRERLGLPPEEENEEDKEEEEEKKEEPKEDEIMAKRVEEFLQNVERSRHVRPWDVGKDGVKPRVLSQKEFNEQQRAKRIQEFAPPTSYVIDTCPDEEPSGLRFTTKRKKRNHVESTSTPINFEYDIDGKKDAHEVAEQRHASVEIPPPSSYDQATLPKNRRKIDLSESIEMGLKKLRHEAEMKSKRKRQNSFDDI